MRIITITITATIDTAFIADAPLECCRTVRPFR